MILVSMGSQPIQCERIINTIIDAGINDEILIQAYHKNFNRELPPNIKLIDFIPYDEMDRAIKKAEIIVTSGTGSILRCLKMHKKVIIFPRLGRYKEALNDHGMDMKLFAKNGYAEFVEEAKNFKKAYHKCLKTKYKKYVSNTDNFIDLLKKELEKLL